MLNQNRDIYDKKKYIVGVNIVARRKAHQNINVIVYTRSSTEEEQGHLPLP